MNTKERAHLGPTHKILLVTDEPTSSLTHLFSSLQKEGIDSTLISKDDLDNSSSSIHTTFLWIHTPHINDEILSTTMNLIPELTGVLFCIDKGMSRLDIFRSIAQIRRHYVAIIGALFLVESDTDEHFGVDICRRTGIPYLFSARKHANEYLIGKQTIDILTEMAR